MLTLSSLSWTQFSLLRSARLDLSQTRPVCVPRLSQESVLTFHTLSLILFTCFLLWTQLGPPALSSGKLLGKTSPAFIWPGRGDPQSTPPNSSPLPSPLLPQEKQASLGQWELLQLIQQQSRAACTVDRGQSQPCRHLGKGNKSPSLACAPCVSGRYAQEPQGEGPAAHVSGSCIPAFLCN